MTWTTEDELRIRELRETAKTRELQPAERSELRALRHRETVEAFDRRRKFFKQDPPSGGGADAAGA